MHFHLAPLIRIAYAGGIDWPLTLVGISIIAIDITVATDSSICILDTTSVDIVLVDLPDNLLHLLLLWGIVLADLTTLVAGLILLVLSYQVLQISFILAVIGITLLALGYLRIITLQRGSTLIGSWSGNYRIVSHWVIGVLDTSRVILTWCILSMLYWEHVVNVHLWVWWVDHVKVVLVALTHCILGCVHDCFLLAGAGSSQRLLMDCRLLVGLVLWASSLTLIGWFGADDLLF